MSNYSNTRPHQRMIMLFVLLHALQLFRFTCSGSLGGFSQVDSDWLSMILQKHSESDTNDIVSL